MEIPWCYKPNDVGCSNGIRKLFGTRNWQVFSANREATSASLACNGRSRQFQAQAGQCRKLGVGGSTLAQSSQASLSCSLNAETLASGSSRQPAAPFAGMRCVAIWHEDTNCLPPMTITILVVHHSARESRPQLCAILLPVKLVHLTSIN